MLSNYCNPKSIHDGSISYSIDSLTHSYLGNRKDHQPIDGSKF